MDDQTAQAIESLKKGLDRIKTDSLGRIGYEKRGAFTGSGSWTGSHTVTLGELDLILNYVSQPTPVIDSEAITKLVTGAIKNTPYVVFNPFGEDSFTTDDPNDTLYNFVKGSQRVYKTDEIFERVAKIATDCVLEALGIKTTPEAKSNEDNHNAS